MSIHRRPNLPSPHLPIRRLAFGLLCGLLIAGMLSGCLPGQKKQAQQRAQIMEPPYVPAPSGEIPHAPETAKPAAETFAYADLTASSAESPQDARLREAIHRALVLGVLKPASTQERFEPDKPIRYNEFRIWTLAYQSSLSGAGMVPTEITDITSSTASGKPGKPASETKTTQEHVFAADQFQVLPKELSWEDRLLSDSETLTRQDLCFLYAFLSNQLERLKNPNPGTIKAMRPGKNVKTQGSASDFSTEIPNDDEAFEQFKDYAAIGEWARPAVALTYQEGLLQNLFGLTPNRLTLEEGLSPQKPVTRSEAMLLLHHLYGDRKPHPPSTNRAGTLPINTPVPENTPHPIRQAKSFQEKGPGYSRQALQVTGGD